MSLNIETRTGAMDRHGHETRRHAVVGFMEHKAFSRSACTGAEDRTRASSARRDAALRVPPRAANAPARLRIWDVDPEALRLVLGVLVTREELERCFASVGDASVAEAREDAVRTKAALRCTRPCALAERIEAVLSERSAALNPLPCECPMIEIANRWAATREALAGPEAAALLWQLASDPRPHLEPLATAVRGELWTRALRLAREDREARRSALPA